MLSGAALAPLAWALPSTAQTLPVPTALDGATVTNFDPGGAPGFGLRVDLNDQNRVIQWSSFDVGTPTSAVEQIDFTTAANTPFAVLNRVAAGNPSEIFGRITSKNNVSVWLVNPSGITFGPTGSFAGGSLLLSTAALNASIEADFRSGTDPVLLRNHSTTAGIVLQAGSGELRTAGPIVVIAQRIDASKAMGSTGDDVALIAATDVVVPDAFGSPLGIAIMRGTTVGSARLDANGAIDAQNVRLYGARRDDITAALLNVGSGATLTATAANGKVVLAAGVATSDTDLSFAGAAPGDVDGIANIAHAGRLTATGAGGDVLIATNGAIGGGGDLTATLGGVTLTAPLTSDLVVGDITTADAFTLATQANLTTGSITVTGGGIALSTSTATGGFIQTGALQAREAVTVDAATTANVLSAAAGFDNPAARDVSITGAGLVTLGGGTATRDILLTSTAGDVSVTGDLVASRTVTVDAAGAATVARGVTATAGNYSVDGASVILGTADPTPTTQSARGFVRITADTTSVSGLGALTVRSNALGGGDGADARFLQLSALTDLALGGTVVEGGSANQSVLALAAGGDITFRTVRARRIVPAADFALPFTTPGDFTATDLTVAQNLAITSTAGSLRLGQTTSTAGNITLAADAGDITGLGGAAPAGPLDPAFGRANLTASTANRTITATAFGTAQFGTLTAGAGNGALAADQITITAGSVGNPGAIAVDSANARNGNARFTAIEGAVTLASATTRGDLSVLADTLASVTGPITVTGDYRVSGLSVALGGEQRAGGLVDVTATGGAITGAAGAILQSNSAGQADAANTRFLRLTATGGAIDFAADSQVLAGTTGQSALALNADATAIRLGTVRARTITDALAASSFTTAADITAQEVTILDTLDLTTTGSLQLGPVVAGVGTGTLAGTQIALTGSTVDVTQTTARNGGLLVQSTVGDVVLGADSTARGAATIEAQANARLGGLTSSAGLVDVRTTTGDVTGLASGGGFARADLAASAADQSVLVTSAGAVTLGTLRAGQDVTVRAGSAITPSDGAIDLLAVTATNGDFTLDAVSADLAAPLRNGDVTLGTGTAGRDGTITASGDIRLGSALTTTATGRTLSLTAGTVGVSTDGAAIVDGTITTGTTSATGAYNVTASRIALTGPAHSARAAVDLFAYGVGAADGITGGTGLTLTSNRANAATDNPLLLRADGGSGIAFAADSTLLGGANGISADIGIRESVASLTLGTVRARSLQGLNAVTPAFGTLTAPNAVTVTGAVTLANTVAVRGALAIESQTGGIATRAITVGTAADGDRSLTLTALGAGGEITANGALLAFGNVTLDAFGDIRVTGITTSPLPTPTPLPGDITLTSLQGNITGLADPLAALAPFGIGSLQSDGGVTLTLPDNASIDGIDAQGLIDLDGASIRLGSATSRGGSIDITTTGALTGTAGSFAGFGTVTADLTARGSINVTAGGVGQPQAVNLRDLTAGTDITVTADRIALRGATATTGTLTLTAGSTLALGTGSAGSLIDISGTGAATAPAITPDFANGVLDTNFGSTDLTADTNGQTVTVRTGTIAQLGTVRAGTVASAGGATQINLSAGALTVGTITARNGDILAATDGSIADPFGSPLYIGTIAAANSVTLLKLGNTGLSHDELRIGRTESGLAGAGAVGNVQFDSAAAIRLGAIQEASGGTFTARATTDLTGLILPAPVGTAPNAPAPGFALLGITADRDIVLDAGNNFQAATLDAGRDIDATALNIAWIGGDAIARAGHYRVTGGSVLLGTPGGATQSAGTDVTIQSTAGDIIGGSGLRLTSDRPNSGAATSYLVLDSASGIAFANGLNGDTVSVLRGGADGASADIGIRLAAGETLQLGNVLARSLGSASGPAGVPPVYTVAPVLTTGGAISARDITVASDLVIDNFASGFGLTLDTARSTGGGISLTTNGDLNGRETATPGDFVRTDLTAALGIDTLSGFGLFGTVDAGTGVRLTTNSARLDATNVIARGGNLVLDSADHLRVDSVTATGDGIGATPAQLLTNAEFSGPLNFTGGNISAFAVGDVTDTALGGSAIFTSTTGRVRIQSAATVTGEGAILVDQVLANGTTANHNSVSIEGRRIAIGTSVQSAGGDVLLTAVRRGAAHADISVTAPLVDALDNVLISADFGTAPTPTLDNGSLRLGSITARRGFIDLLAPDGDITGLAGASDGLDSGHARTTLTADSLVTTRSGGLTLAGVITGAGARINAGDVTQRGLVANNGAIDIARIVTTGPVLLTARAATATGGFGGDIRIGATAAAQPIPGIAATTAGSAELTTSGVRGDIVIASGLDAVGNIALRSIANARLAGNDIAPLGTHILRSTGGSVSARAVGDLTGLRLPAPVGTAPNPPEPAFGLIDITAANAISLAAGSDLQAATLTAGTDIDATAGGFAWLGGTMTANAGHYRVTGGTVLLGTPGNAVQTAATDVAIRSTVGGITGGSGLLLTSDSGNSGATNRYLVLDSAADITFANGLNGDTISTIRGGTDGMSADIGIRLPAGATLQLGNVFGRIIGTATGPSGVPPFYTITPGLVTGGAINLRDITVAGDLIIDDRASGLGLTLDTATSTGGGINLATAGDLKGRESDTPGVFVRTDLTAALGVETLSGFALLGTVDAGTGVQLATSSGVLDATNVIARGGDLVLDSASHLRVDTVTASGDGSGLVPAQMLLNAAFPQASLTTAGDITALAGRDVTDTALGGSAAFTSTTGGVRIESTATIAGEGVMRADRVSAGGTLAGHREIAITGRRIAIGTSVVSSGGGVALTASQTGEAQSDVSITVPLIQALGNTTLTTGAGSAATPGLDNGNIRVGSVNIGAGSLTLSALDGNITGLAGVSDGLDPLHDRAVLAASGNITTRSGGLTLANTVTGSNILMEAGTATRPGALDVTQIAATGALTLTARGGDIRLGTAATGQPTPGAAATTAGTTTTLTTSGARGDIVIASALESGGNIALNTVANARLPGGAPAASIRSLSGNIAIIGSGDITGLQRTGTPGTALPDFARADLTTGATGTITLTTTGTAQLGTVTAGAPGLPNIADQITATAGTIDITTATARNGNLRLTSTLGDVLLGTGEAQINATIAAAVNARIDTLFTRTGSIALTTTSGDVVLGTGTAGANAGVNAAANARLGTLTAQSGNIAITAGADVSGLAAGTGFGRADLTTGNGTAGSGTISVNAATGAISLGTVTAGTTGQPNVADQIVASAQAIDITTATARNGTLRLTSTLGDVLLGTGDAQINATIAAAVNAQIDTLTARTGSIALTTTSGDVVLGTGDAQINAVISAAANAQIDTLTARTGNIAVTTTRGDVILGTGTAGVSATIDAAANTRLGTLTAQSGNIAIIAGADVSGLAAGTSFGRADLTTGNGTSGVGTITVTAANGALSLGTVTAGTTGQPDIADQIVASAQAIDITTANARNGTLSLTSTLGDVLLGTGDARIDATIAAAVSAQIGTLTARTGNIALTTTSGDVVLGTGTAGADASVNAAANARVGTLTAQSGNIAITAGADVSGLAAGTGFGRADLTTGDGTAGTGTITVTAANGALSLGAVTAGTTGQPDIADQIVATAEAIDITSATASNGNLSLTSTLGDVTLGTGDARGAATIAAATNAGIGSLTTRTGAITATATQGAVALTTGVAATDATITAETDIAVGTLAAQTGAIAITATTGNIAGNPGGGANLATLASGQAITLTANTGTATLGTLDSVDGAITLTARDADLTGPVNADSETITILRGTGATATRIGTFATPATTPTLTLDDAEMGRLAADTIVIGSGTDASDIAIGGLTLGTATGDQNLKFLGTGKITLSGAITDAGAVARTLQIGGDATAIDSTTATPLALPLASRIEATLGSDTSGASIALPAATVDLRGARITFSDTAVVQGRDSIRSIATETEGQSDAAAAQIVADRLVSSSGSGLYRNNQSRNVFLKAKQLRVSYSGFALFQNTDPSLQGLGVELNLTTPAANGSSPVLELRSLGDSPANSFALFGTINGFVGRTAGLLPNTVLEFVDPSRTVRITQSNSRVNGCVIGSPDRGCLITDAPPPTLRLFDQRQLQLFGVADDLTIPFEPSVGSSNEALIGDFTTTGGLIDPDCTVPDAPGCPTPGERP